MPPPIVSFVKNLDHSLFGSARKDRATSSRILRNFARFFAHGQSENVCRKPALLILQLCQASMPSPCFACKLACVTKAITLYRQLSISSCQAKCRSIGPDAQRAWPTGQKTETDLARVATRAKFLALSIEVEHAR